MDAGRGFPQQTVQQQGGGQEKEGGQCAHRHAPDVPVAAAGEIRESVASAAAARYSRTAAASGAGGGKRCRFPRAGGQGQDKTWAGKAGGQCCACGFLAFFRPWPGRQSAKNRLPAQGEGRCHPFLSAFIPRFQRISRKGGTRRMAQIPSWHMAGRPLCLLAGLFRGRQPSRPLSAGRRVLRILCLQEGQQSPGACECCRLSS